MEVGHRLINIFNQFQEEFSGIQLAGYTDAQLVQLLGTISIREEEFQATEKEMDRQDPAFAEPFKEPRGMFRKMVDQTRATIMRLQEERAKTHEKGEEDRKQREEEEGMAGNREELKGQDEGRKPNNSPVETEQSEEEVSSQTQPEGFRGFQPGDESILQTSNFLDKLMKELEKRNRESASGEGTSGRSGKAHQARREENPGEPGTTHPTRVVEQTKPGHPELPIAIEHPKPRSMELPLPKTIVYPKPKRPDLPLLKPIMHAYGNQPSTSGYVPPVSTKPEPTYRVPDVPIHTIPYSHSAGRVVSESPKHGPQVSGPSGHLPQASSTPKHNEHGGTTNHAAEQPPTNVPFHNHGTQPANAPLPTYGQHTGIEDNNGATHDAYNPMGLQPYYNPNYMVPGPQAYFPMPQFRMQVENIIKIPQFNGNWDQWIPFKAAFTKFIHNNPNLDNLSKLAQLLQHVLGQAYDAIKGFPFQDDQYQEAWWVLLRRYDRKDPIIDETISRVMGLPNLRGNTTSERITMFVNVTNQMLRTLPTFGIDVSSWDPIIKYILISKFDEETLIDWKTFIGTQQQVPLKKLIEFLELRMFCTNKQPSIKMGHPQALPLRNTIPKFNRTSGIHTVLEDSESKCLKCKGPHMIFRCRELLNLTAKQRTEEIRKLGLCFKCLKKHEGTKADCSIGNCPICDGPHNTLICYKRERDYQDQQKKKDEESSKRGQGKGNAAVNHA